MAKNHEKNVLYRVVKFEIFLNVEQFKLLRKISDNLWLVWNEALGERTKAFDMHVAPVYQAIKEGSERQDKARVAELRSSIKDAYEKAQITLFDQINALTPRRARDPGFASTPRNWQEETLDTLNGAFKSFVSLRKNGDRDARPPKERSEWDQCEIPGRYGFSIKGGRIELGLNTFGKGVMSWPIPQEYQGLMLARSSKVKKFTLYRDVRDMREKGRWWISIAYELPKPDAKPFVAHNAVFVAIGSSSIGIVSPKGEELIELGRPDKHWKPAADGINERIEKCVKGSRAWKRRMKARRTVFAKMAGQQKLGRRTIVAQDLLRHGVHFVVTDLVVRSKEGRLADGSKAERGGALGLNWSAQNTGSIAYLVQWLEEKAVENGGSVRKHRLPHEYVPNGTGHENKIPMALALRDDFLRSLQVA